MNYWGAGFSLAFEIDRPVINLVLDKLLQAIKSKLNFAGKIGKIGSFDAEVTNVEIMDLEDPPPLGGVVTDLLAEARFRIKLFGLQLANTQMAFKIFDIEIDLAKTVAGLPKGLSLGILASSSVSLTFPNAKFIIGWLLNKVISPIITFGIWLAFSIFRGKKIDIPVWELVDAISVLGIRYDEKSPLLTAQKAVPPTSILFASDFILTNSTLGDPNNLKHFIPANTNIGAIVHERVITAAVQMAFAKGWVPTQFKVKKWKIYINYVKISFEQGKIRATGKIKAKRGNCWCRVKVRIYFNAAVEPVIEDAQTNPRIAFDYDAQINTHISTSGMLVVLGVIMFAPVFMAITVAMSYVVNVMLDKFLPFSTSWGQSGASLTIVAKSVHFSGFVPLSMNFPLQLFGHGSYDLANYTKFDLPFNGPQINVGYTPDTISLQDDELRLAIKLT